MLSSTKKSLISFTFINFIIFSLFEPFLRLFFSSTSKISLEGIKFPSFKPSIKCYITANAAKLSNFHYKIEKSMLYIAYILSSSKQLVIEFSKIDFFH